jgi:hypothetical protein
MHLYNLSVRNGQNAVCGSLRVIKLVNLGISILYQCSPFYCYLYISHGFLLCTTPSSDCFGGILCIRMHASVSPCDFICIGIPTNVTYDASSRQFVMVKHRSGRQTSDVHEIRTPRAHSQFLRPRTRMMNGQRSL